MNCALWLNKHKIHHASEIAENLDVASLRGYFLAGSLTEWLNANGGEEYAKRLSKLSPDDGKLNEKLARVFGGKPLPSKSLGAESILAVGTDSTEKVSSFAVNGGSMSYAKLSSFGSFWELWSGQQAGSFGSFAFGSYSQWAWLFERFAKGYGSFFFGSFTSYHEWEWEWLFRFFTGGYGSFGSFGLMGFGSLSAELFGSFPSFSDIADLSELPELDEYDRIMFETLMMCPLDRFGYGIHNI